MRKDREIPFHPLVTISLLCHNNLKYTISCIQSILTQTQVPFQLFITDNNSTDDTPSYLDSITHLSVSVFHNHTNKGFITAHNEALEKAAGQYFIVLNNDLTVSGDWLGIILAGFSDNQVKIVGPVGCRLAADGVGYEFRGDDIDYIEGSCLAIQTSFARQIGLFSTQYEFMYCEDSDLSLRVRAMGYKIKKVNACVNHIRGVTTNGGVKADVKGYSVKNHYKLKTTWDFYLKKRSFEKEIFINRTAAVGDVFLITPIIEHLKKENIHLKINVITKCPQLLEGNPLIHKIWRTPPPKVQIINLDGVYETNPFMHIVHAFAQFMGISQLSNPLPVFYIKDEDIRSVAEYSLTNYIVLHAGPTHWPGRQLPIPTFIQIVEILKEKGYQTVEIGHASSLPNVDVNLTNVSWSKTAALIKNAQAFIGIDSAPMHLAQAFQKPGAVVFGCVDPQYRIVNPELLRPVVQDVACRFCHHWQAAPRIYSGCLRDDPVCMNRITPQQVIEQLEIALNQPIPHQVSPMPSYSQTVPLN